MTDRNEVANHEKLIEEAASAIHSVAEGGAPWTDARMADKDQHRAEARAALAVFEKALGEATVTPTAHEVTTDERVNAALNEHRLSDLLNSGYGPERFHKAPDLSYWHPDNVSNMRAALRAAWEVR